MKCIECGIEFDGRSDAKFCSPKCRVTFNRKSSIVTDNVTVSVPTVTDKFEFLIVGKLDLPSRTAKYWYDVPLAAVPIIKKDWPKMPSFMNGRQYFLWWKNNFESQDGKPVILNIK